MMFFTVIIIFGLGISFSGGGLKIVGMVILGLIALVVLLSIVGSGGGVGAGTVIISMVAASALFILWAENTKKVQAAKGRGTQAQVGVVTSPSGVVETKVWAYPGTNYTPLVVGAGTNMWWVVDHPTERIMYHFNNERPEQDQEDWKDGPTRVLPRMPWAYTAHLRAKGLVSVPVTVYLTPIR